MTNKSTPTNPQNPHGAKKLNLYAGLDAKEELERLADIASHNRGTRISKSEIFKKMMERLTERDINNWFPKIKKEDD